MVPAICGSSFPIRNKPRTPKVEAHATLLELGLLLITRHFRVSMVMAGNPQEAVIRAAVVTVEPHDLPSRIDGVGDGASVETVVGARASTCAFQPPPWICFHRIQLL